MRGSTLNGYRYLAFLLLVLPLTLIAGFWIPYFSEIPKFDSSITTAVHIHAILLFAWVALLFAQPLAIRNRALPLHRSLGKISYALVPLVLIFAIAMLIKEYREHIAAGMSPVSGASAEYLSTCQLALFAAFYSLAIVRIHRRDAAEHMRYIICIALVLLPAGLSRTLGYWFNVRQAQSQAVCFIAIDVCLISLIMFDRRRKLGARPFIVAFAAYVAVEVVWIALGRPV